MQKTYKIKFLQYTKEVIYEVGCQPDYEKYKVIEIDAIRGSNRVIIRLENNRCIHIVGFPYTTYEY